MNHKIDYSVNYYDVLGVSKDATSDEIKTKYRKLAQHNHPDKNTHDKATDVFLLITEAYAVLSDATLRKQYNSKFKNKKLKQFSLDITFLESLNGVKINTHLGMIDIPKGIRNKAKLVFLDHIIEIIVTPHESYTRDGDDLYTNFNISSLTAMTGGKEMYHHVTGDKMSITIPRCTQHGDIFKVAGYGANNTETNIVGDLYLKGILITPVLTDEYIAAIVAASQNQ